MPYCPKCKFKYNEGISKCPDCECDLVDTIEELPYDSESEETIYAEEVPGEKAVHELLHTKNTHFVSKSDKYNDLHSSSWSLIIVAICGDILLILNSLNILPIHFAFEGLSGILFYVVMGSMLNIFLIGGIISLKSASKVKSEISAEEDLTKDIIEYMTTNFNKDSIDSQINSEDEISSYFEREKFLKNAITSKYPELEDAFLENIIEQLYQDIFENA